jgi:hypothetical protein
MLSAISGLCASAKHGLSESSTCAIPRSIRKLQARSPLHNVEAHATRAVCVCAYAKVLMVARLCVYNKHAVFPGR